MYSVCPVFFLVLHTTLAKWIAESLEQEARYPDGASSFFPHSQLSRFLGWRKEIKEMLMGADFTEIADFEKQVGF